MSRVAMARCHVASSKICCARSDRRCPVMRNFARSNKPNRHSKNDAPGRAPCDCQRHHEPRSSRTASWRRIIPSCFFFLFLFMSDLNGVLDVIIVYVKESRASIAVLVRPFVGKVSASLFYDRGVFHAGISRRDYIQQYTDINLKSYWFYVYFSNQLNLGGLYSE